MTLLFNFDVLEYKMSLEFKSLYKVLLCTPVTKNTTISYIRYMYNNKCDVWYYNFYLYILTKNRLHVLSKFNDIMPVSNRLINLIDNNVLNLKYDILFKCLIELWSRHLYTSDRNYSILYTKIGNIINDIDALEVVSYKNRIISSTYLVENFTIVYNMFSCINCNIYKGILCAKLMLYMRDVIRPHQFEFLIDNGLKLNYYYTDGISLLGYLCNNNKIEHVKIALSKGCKVNMVSNLNILDGDNKYSWYPINDACMKSNRELALVLVEHGSILNLDHRSWNNPLHLCISNYKWDMFLFLIEHGVNLETRDCLGNTPLMLASCLDSITYIDRLLDESVNVNAVNDEGNTSLHFAVVRLESYHKVTRLLLAGANSNIPNKFNITPIMYACNREINIFNTVKYDTVELLLSSGANPNIYNINNYNNKYLYKDQKDITYVYGRTLFFNASMSADIRLIDMLLKYNAETVSDNNFSSLLFYLCEKGNTEIIKLYISHGLNPNRKDCNGIHLIHYACATGNIDIIRMLIEFECDLRVKDAKGTTVLHYAAEFGNIEIFELLLSYGLNINEKDEYGDIPIHYALNSNVEFLEYLIRKGSDINSINKLRMTVFQCALETGNCKTIKCLLKHK